MVVKNICFTEYLEKTTDIENDSLDVFVELEGGFTYTVVVGIPKNIEYLMDKEKVNYFRPGHPFILVKKLTKDIIKKAVIAYAEDFDEYWLKLDHFASDINEGVFDELQAEYMKNRIELDNS